MTSALSYQPHALGRAGPSAGKAPARFNQLRLVRVCPRFSSPLRSKWWRRDYPCSWGDSWCVQSRARSIGFQDYHRLEGDTNTCGGARIFQGRGNSKYEIDNRAGHHFRVLSCGEGPRRDSLSSAVGQPICPFDKAKLRGETPRRRFRAAVRSKRSVTNKKSAGLRTSPPSSLLSEQTIFVWYKNPKRRRG